MRISDVLDANTVIPALKSTDKPSVIEELAELLALDHPVINKERLIEALLEREKLCSTAVDSGVAIPHAKLSGISGIILGFGRSEKGIEFDSLDRLPTQLFVILVSPENSSGEHIELLARISMIFKQADFRTRLLNAGSKEELYEYIISEDEKLK